LKHLIVPQTQYESIVRKSKIVRHPPVLVPCVFLPFIVSETESAKKSIFVNPEEFLVIIN